MANKCDRCGNESELGQSVNVVTMDRVAKGLQLPRYFDIRGESFWFCRDCILEKARRTDVLRPVKSLFGTPDGDPYELSNDQLYALFRHEISRLARRWVVTPEEYARMVKI